MNYEFYTYYVYVSVVFKLANNTSSLHYLLQKMAKWSGLHNGKFPDPYTNIKFEKEEKKEKKKKKKKLLRDQRDQQIDTNGNKVRSKEKKKPFYLLLYIRQ